MWQELSADEGGHVQLSPGLRHIFAWGRAVQSRGCTPAAKWNKSLRIGLGFTDMTEAEHKCACLKRSVVQVLWLGGGLTRFWGLHYLSTNKSEDRGVERQQLHHTLQFTGTVWLKVCVTYGCKWTKSMSYLAQRYCHYLLPFDSVEMTLKQIKQKAALKDCLWDTKS